MGSKPGSMCVVSGAFLDLLTLRSPTCNMLSEAEKGGWIKWDKVWKVYVKLPMIVPSTQIFDLFSLEDVERSQQYNPKHLKLDTFQLSIRKVSWSPR